MSVDVLMVTYNRPTYTRLSLEHLLDSCDASMRVWVWHNGNDQDTLDVVASMRGHARFHEFHHCPENRRIRPVGLNRIYESSLAPHPRVQGYDAIPTGQKDRARPHRT